jgi:hypothetical protein
MYTYIHLCRHTCVHTYMHRYIHTYRRYLDISCVCLNVCKFLYTHCAAICMQCLVLSTIMAQEHFARMYIPKGICMLTRLVRMRHVFYVCVYVCMYVYVYTHAHVLYMYKHLQTFTYMYILSQTCTYFCTHILCIYKHVHTFITMYIHIHTCTYMYIHVHTSAHAYRDTFVCRCRANLQV